MAQKREQSATPQTEEKQAQATPSFLPQQYGATTSVNVRIHSLRNDGSLKATASATIAGCFAVRNIMLREGTNGLFVSMPSFKNNKGEYKDICFPVTKEFRQDLNNAVIAAYHQELGQTYAQSQAFPEQESSAQTQQM